MKTVLAALMAAATLAGASPSPQAIRTWQDRKFGMFIHFGLYSALGGEWKGKRVERGYSEQIMAFGGMTKDEHAATASEFNPVKWDPDAVARLAKQAGMKFIVLTSKHHDGFNLFHTKLSPYNVVDATPYKKDIVAGLAEACKRAGLGFGVYYSTLDWHYPGATPHDVPGNDNPIPKKHEEFNAGQLRELTTRYGPLTEIWFDMGHPTPAQSKRFVDTVRKAQPDCMVSGRVFNYQGDFDVMGDNAIPEYIIDEPWQTPGSIYNETWGYRAWQKRENVQGKIAEHIGKLVAVVSRGGNYLLNIGPRGDGSVVEFETEVLEGMGRWMEANGEAIYGTAAQPFRRLEFGHATVKPGKLFLFVKKVPEDGRLVLPGLKTAIKRAYVLAGGAPLVVDGSTVVMPRMTYTTPMPVVVAEYEGTLEVMPETITLAKGRGVRLTPAQADKFYNHNGGGYYARPTIYKLRWNFTAAAGIYRLQLPDGVDAELDGKAVKHGPVKVEARGYHTLTVTPVKPFGKGAALPFFENVGLSPE